MHRLCNTVCAIHNKHKAKGREMKEIPPTHVEQMQCIQFLSNIHLLERFHQKSMPCGICFNEGGVGYKLRPKAKGREMEEISLPVLTTLSHGYIM